MSYVLNNAIGSIEPNFNVDYASALVSKGGLSTVLNPTTDLATAGEVTFNWDDNSAEGNANTTDKAMLLVYNPSKKEFISLTDRAYTTVGSQIVAIPTTYAGDRVELFMAFITADGSQVSNNTYLGFGTAN